MGIFDFMSEGVEQAVNITGQQMQRVEDMIATIGNVIAPLQNGGWIGEGAQAFFEDADRLLADAKQTLEEMRAFQQALIQTIQRIMETQQQAITVISG